MSFYDDASWLLVPSGIKEDVVYAQKPISGLGDLAFTRASDATYTDASGVVRRSPYNLVTWSEMFSDVAWAKTNTSISANVTNAPNGTLTADKLIAANGTSIVGDYVQQNVTKGASIISYTFTTYAKANELNGTRIYVRDSISAANFAQVYFNLITGTIDTAATSGGNFSNASATITANVNGWYRVSLTFTSSTDTQILARIYTYDTVKTTGNGTDGIFIWGAQLVEGSSALDYFPTTNRQDVPRIDFRNADGTLSSCGRLLLEPQRTNSVPYSEQFDNAAWSKSGATISANSTTSPSGNLDADKLVENTANAEHVVFRSAAGAGATFSFFAKAAGRNFVAVLSNNGTFSFFNIGNGTLGTIAATSTATITPYGNGWYRCTLFNSHVTFGAVINLASANGTTVYAGDGTSGAFIWGAQFEASATYATSYIPTLGAAVTRLADAASKTGVSSLIGQTEGTWFCEIDLSKLLGTTARDFFVIGDGRVPASASSVYCSFSGIGTNLLRARVVQSGVVKYDQRHTITSTGTYKIALAYKSQDCAMYVNGSFAGTVAQNDAFSFSLNQIFTSFDSSAFQFADGVAQAAIFPTRLTNEQLAQLTTL